MEALLAISLSGQIALAMLVPGVLFHGRTLLPVDGWVFMTLLTLAAMTIRLGRWPDRRWLATTLGIVFLLALSFVHGFYRIPIADELLGLGIAVQESDRFNFLHEFVIVIRFMSWILEGVWVWWILKQMGAYERRRLGMFIARVLLGISTIAALLTILSGLSSSFTDWLASIYGFQGDLPIWRGRAFGPFRSPLDAGLTLSLCLLILLSARKGRVEKDKPISVVGCLLGVGVVLSHTFTAIGALLFTWFVTRFAALRARRKVFLSLSGVVILGVFFYAKRDFLELKWGDFIYRFIPWKVMFKALIRHPGEALLGHGFAPINVDNGYLFVLFRLGILGFSALAYLAFRWGKDNWKSWSLSQREILIFLLVTALTLDTFILRPVVMVFIAAGLPLLAIDTRAEPLGVQGVAQSESMAEERR